MIASRPHPAGAGVHDADLARQHSASRGRRAILSGAQETRRRGAQTAARRNRSFVNDEYSDVIFALYALKARACRRACSCARRRRSGSDCCTCRASRRSNILGEQPGADLRRVLLSAPGDARRLRSRHLRRAPAPERGDAGRLDRNQGPTGVHPPRRRLRRSAEDPRHADRRRRPQAETGRHRGGQARLRRSGDLPDPPRWRAGPVAGRRDAGRLERTGPRQGAGRGGGAITPRCRWAWA